ncbi:MAG: glycosyltransferase [Clostridiales bacterium]|nr:glycosyltransferase [Clostridiales bacterium]
MDFSVIVLTYKAAMDQLKRTLGSIIKQRDIEYEIIVCDDGSAENHFEEVRLLLDRHGVSNYRLLGSESNQGTVRNILKGLTVAEGKYAKLIGAGDLLYHDHILRDIRDFMEEQQAPCCFGLMRGYHMVGDGMEFKLHDSPRDIRAYREKDTRRIARNLMLCEDWVSGAGIFAQTDYYRKYISMLEGHVRFCEDWSSTLSAVDGVFPEFYDQYVVWYEVGDGISTSANAEFRQKLAEDNRQFWKLFDEYCKTQGRTEYARYIRKRKRKKRLENVGSLVIQNLYKSIVNPDMVFFEMDVRRQKRQGAHLPGTEKSGFLDIWQGGESHAGD